MNNLFRRCCDRQLNFLFYRNPFCEQYLTQACLAAWRKTTAPAQQEAKLELLLQQLTAGRCPHPQAVCRYLAPELHGFVQQLAVTRQEGLGHLAVCME